MSDALMSMVNKLAPKTFGDYDHAVREVIQKISLLGLWRSRFFEKAAFYGGTALRLFHGLDRFSEDLDFSLLERDQGFHLKDYHGAVVKELESFGFGIEITSKKSGAVESAFIKTETAEVLMNIDAPDSVKKLAGKGKVWKVKFEVDTDPPGGFDTEVRYLLEPIPTSIRVYAPSSLFAGKMHAVLCRGWKERVKGRDWYDMVFYVSKGIAVKLHHLKERLVQTGHWDGSRPFGPKDLRLLLEKRIDQIDLNAAKRDVVSFLKDPDSVNAWSKDFFRQIATQIKVEV